MNQDLNARTVAVAQLAKGFTDDGMVIPEGQTVYVLLSASARGEADLPADFGGDVMRCVTTIAIDHQGVCRGWIADIRIRDLRFTHSLRVRDIDMRDVDVRNAIAIELMGVK